MKKLLPLILIMFLLSSCYWNVDEIKTKAPAFLKERDYTIRSYDGYDTGFNGGNCWYQVTDSAGYVYSLALMKWGDEIHIYDQKCLNAVSNQ